uniref:GOLGA2L5 domain-containing protein n=1 Tax=Gongylonema pulchrum TaxID=637853 RepID=A0A183EKX0_9BILA
LEKVSNEKLLLESKVESLESQIELLQMLDDKGPSVKNGSSSSRTTVSELRQMESKLNDAESGLRSAEKLNEQLTIKKAELSTKNGELAAAEESLVRTRSLVDEQLKHTEGMLSLSEQLQNEKATVSRAIAQNRELKDQLIELQDRLVAVTQVRACFSLVVPEIIEIAAPMAGSSATTASV